MLVFRGNQHGFFSNRAGTQVHYVDRHQKMRFEYEKGTKDQEVRQIHEDVLTSHIGGVSNLMLPILGEYQTWCLKMSQK